MAKNSKKDIKKEPKINISPLGDRVLLKAIEDKSTKTASGIYLPEGANVDKSTKKAVVVAIGPGRTEKGNLIPVDVKVGQTVLYSWGDTIKDGDEEYILVREGEILAIIK
jgi:chaperonin GroES